MGRGLLRSSRAGGLDQADEQNWVMKGGKPGVMGGGVEEVVGGDEATPAARLPAAEPCRQTHI